MTDLSHIKEFGKLEPGDKVLVTVGSSDPDEVNKISELLVQRFPGVQFTIIAGPIEITVMKNERI